MHLIRKRWFHTCTNIHVHPYSLYAVMLNKFIIPQHHSGPSHMCCLAIICSTSSVIITILICTCGRRKYTVPEKQYQLAVLKILGSSKYNCKVGFTRKTVYLIQKLCFHIHLHPYSLHSTFSLWHNVIVDLSYAQPLQQSTLSSCAHMDKKKVHFTWKQNLAVCSFDFQHNTR